jgi:cell wall-associated NlpC family hydrolase
MTLDGMAAVQARIAEIDHMFTTTSPVAARSAPSAKTDFASLLADASGTSTALPNAPTNGSSQLAQQFLQTALAERGKPYVYGATANTNDPDPKAFDCSELTKWAAARAGVTIPDGATAQYLYTRDHGTTMSVDQALHTPGALLFHFGHEPKNLGDIPADGHVAISLGDGAHTIEARGHRYGTNIFDATGNRAGFFNFAGMIPGM